MKHRSFWEAVAILVGMVVGAGIFGLPYAFAKIGFWGGVGYLVVLSLAFLITNFCYGEIVLRTKENLEMPGYVQKYLGRNGKILITVSMILGVYGALTAYLVGIGGFLHAIFEPVFSLGPIWWSLIFWVLASLVILKGIGIVSRLELGMAFALIIAMFLIIILSLPCLDFNNLSYFNIKAFFFPYGVVLFALGGASAIPTMRKILKNKTELLKPALIIGLIIPVLIYLIFTFAVVGVCGTQTSETAIIGLGKIVHPQILLIGGIFGILAMTTSFLVLAHILKELLQIDYKIPAFPSWAITILVPIILLFSGFQSFIKIIGFSGGVLAGLQGIILIIAYYQAKKKGNRQPEFTFNLARPIAWIICILFAIGIVYQFIYH